MAKVKVKKQSDGIGVLNLRRSDDPYFEREQRRYENAVKILRSGMVVFKFKWSPKHKWYERRYYDLCWCDTPEKLLGLALCISQKQWGTRDMISRLIRIVSTHFNMKLQYVID